MAIVGRLLREQMRLDAVSNTPAAIQERLDMREAGRLAHADMLAKFPEFSPEFQPPASMARLGTIAREAIDFQEERFKFHMQALAAARKGR